MFVQLHEPDLFDLLNDPLVHLVMASDGVTRAALRSVVRCAQHASHDHDEVTGDSAIDLSPIASLPVPSEAVIPREVYGHSI
ncbi:MAG: hypothetical protein WCC64_13105 [Aliidongia sp.]